MTRGHRPQLGSSIHTLDEARLVEQFAGRAASAIGDVAPGSLVEVHGEVREVRIVPAGTDRRFEAQVSDGTGTVIAVWVGGDRPAGVRPGSDVRLIGTVDGGGTRPVMLDPLVEASVSADET